MSFEITTLLTELAGGRRPLWKAQTSTSGPPAALTAGLALDVGSGRSALVTAARIRVREDVQYRTARFRFVYSNGATYAFNLVGLAGTPVSFTAGPGDDEEAIVDGLIAALALEANHAAVLVGTKEEPSAGVFDLVIRGKDDAVSGTDELDDFVLGALSAGGGGGGESITCTADPNHAIAYLWALSGGDRAVSSDSLDPVETWGRPFADDAPALTTTRQGAIYVDWQGWTDTFNTGGVSRLYFEVDQANGPTGEVVSADLVYRPPDVYIGPAFRESAESGV